MYLLNSEQREHLKLVRENTPEGFYLFHLFNVCKNVVTNRPSFMKFVFLLSFAVAIEICKLALDYLNNGTNQNRLQTIASNYLSSFSLR